MRLRTANRHAIGFTLVELLVVFSVIALMGAMIFPVFMRAKQRMDLTVCTANARQLGMSVLMYTTDYDETFPYAATVVSPSEANLKARPLKTVLQPYVRNDEVWFCPGWLAKHGDLMEDPYSLWRQYGATYGYNAFPNQPDGTLVGQKLSSIRDPSNKPMLWCASGSAHSSTSPLEWAKGRPGVVNTCYVDGHVKLFFGTLPQFTQRVFGRQASPPNVRPPMRWPQPERP